MRDVAPSAAGNSHLRQELRPLFQQNDLRPRRLLRTRDSRKKTRSASAYDSHLS